MNIREIFPLYEVARDPARCVKCKLCVRECANEVHAFNEKLGLVLHLFRLILRLFVDFFFCLEYTRFA